MMGSTSNALDKGGNNFKQLFYDSDTSKRNTNGQTKSGLYNLFIPMSGTWKVLSIDMVTQFYQILKLKPKV